MSLYRLRRSVDWIAGERASQNQEDEAVHQRGKQGSVKADAKAVWKRSKAVLRKVETKERERVVALEQIVARRKYEAEQQLPYFVEQVQK